MKTTTTETLGSAPDRAATAVARIQSCGFLLVLDQDWRVAHVSDNISDHFADCGGRMIAQPLAEYFGAAAVHSLRNQLALMRDPRGSARLFSLFFASVPKPFDVSLHFQSGRIILESFPAAHVEAGDPAGTVRQLAGRLDACETVTELAQRGSQCLRALTGFDSVSLFRLDAHGQAHRIAEDARGAAPSIDRPPLLETRFIADARRGPCRLEPEAPASLIDRALLRAPEAGTHRPQAAASLSVPLVSAGQPWGVALCLNRTPRAPALDRIAAAELFGELLAMRAELCELRARAGL